ncbi:MAG: PAS domain-containing protein [Acetobacteraceae bacterium]|nr:PAS domain-containing protein [Acetobacteraceae bacterium]
MFPALIESGLNEAGTAVAVIVHPERGATAIIEYANQPFSAVMRRSRAELTGASVQFMLDLVGKAEDRAQLLAALIAGAAVQLDLPLLAGGVENWLGFRLSFPPPGVSGVRYAILIGRDITAARRNATQDDRLRQMLAQIFMRIAAPVAIVGQGGELVMCNNAYRQLTGFSADELKQIRVQDLTPPELAESAAKTRAAQFATGEQYEMDFETLVKSGKRVAVHLTSVLLTARDQPYRVVTLIPRAGSSDAKPAPPAALSAAAQAYAAHDQGELRAISLAAFKSLFGADWERIEFRAMLRAEQVIRKRLNREDVLSRLDDSNFVLWFNSGDSQRNEVALQSIVREVRLSFLAEFSDEMSQYLRSTPVQEAAAAGSPANLVTKEAAD